jgi:hypothetical protein
MIQRSGTIHRIVWRVTGERPDGTTVIRDELTKAKAKDRANRMGQHRQDANGSWLAPVRNITITPSEPVIFDYKKTRKHVPEVQG